MLAVMNRDEIRNQLVDKARKQGTLSYDEILAVFPDAENDIELLDALMDDLLNAGVEVVSQGAHNDALFDSSASAEFEPEMSELAEDEDVDMSAWMVNDTLIEDAGYQQALDSDDVVGLYLKEAGRVPLLTAEEEVHLAKRMEVAEQARLILEERGDSMPLDDVYPARPDL
jgi:RNA polymerase primary sigma factor